MHTEVPKFNFDTLSLQKSNLINMPFATGVFPDICKLARTIPLFKDSDSLNCTNYRPIFFLSRLSKIYEKWMSVRLYSYLEIFWNAI